ncbi:MAG: phosphate acyltransferase [Limisphaerales bacterium]
MILQFRLSPLTCPHAIHRQCHRKIAASSQARCVSRRRGTAHPAGGPAVFKRCGSAAPIVLGDPAKIKIVAGELNIPLDGIRIINPATSEELENFTKRFHSLRREKGLRATEAREAMLQPNYFGTMMLAMHQADGVISGASHITSSLLRPLFSDHQSRAGHQGRRQVAWSWKSRIRASAKGASCSWPIAASSPIRPWISLRISPFPPRGSRVTCSA